MLNSLCSEHSKVLDLFDLLSKMHLLVTVFSSESLERADLALIYESIDCGGFFCRLIETQFHVFS